MERRSFLKRSAAAGTLGLLGEGGWLRGEKAKGVAASAHEMEGRSSFQSDDKALAATWKAAVATLAENVVQLPGYGKPVLVEGSVYHGMREWKCSC
ncbi:MAG: twin-arginine translocation signal domain-containing protein [Acidobacteriaceae bacterium]